MIVKINFKRKDSLIVQKNYRIFFNSTQIFMFFINSMFFMLFIFLKLYWILLLLNMYSIENFYFKNFTHYMTQNTEKLSSKTKISYNLFPNDISQHVLWMSEELKLQACIYFVREIEREKKLLINRDLNILSSFWDSGHDIYQLNTNLSKAKIDKHLM